MSVDVSTSIIIGCPRLEVSDFAEHPSNAPEWYVNIKEVEWKRTPPVAVGSQVAFVANFLGRRGYRTPTESWSWCPVKGS